MTNEGIVVYGKSKLLWCIIVALFVTIVALLGSDGKKEEGEIGLISIVENTKDIKTIEVPLNPETWSDWVELPMNFKSWELRAPSWLEFQFLNGERKSLKVDEKFWWKNTPCRTFKLRGATGKATIVVRL